MAGFSDFMQAMQFGMGLVHGFTNQAAQERQANETRQLALLKILKDEEHDVVPIDPGEVEQGGGIMGALFGAPGGGNTFSIGGRGFKVVKKPPMFGAEPVIVTPSTSTPAPTMKYELPQQAPSFAPTGPATPPVVPGTSTTPQAVEQRTSALPTLKPEVAAYKAYIDKVAPAYGLDPNFVKGLISTENAGWNPTLDNEQYGASGGQGLGQLVPSTASRYNVEDAHDPYKNLNGTMAYLKHLKALYNGDTRRMAAAYVAGEGNIPSEGAAPAQLTIQGRPVDVGRYVQKVHANAQSEAQNRITPTTGTFAGPGATAPPTATSTPEQDILYRTQNRQMGSTGAQAGEPSANDTSVQASPGQQVAGRATPSAPSPTAPLQFSEPEMTLDQKLKVADADLVQRFQKAGVPNTTAERNRFLTLQDRAHTTIMTQHNAELQKAQVNVRSILDRQEIHDPRILELADRVTTDSQVRDLKRYIDANPPIDFLPQATAALQATPTEQRPQKAVELAGELLRYNYKPERLREAFGPFMDEIKAARAVKDALKQHKENKDYDISQLPLQKEQEAKFNDEKQAKAFDAVEKLLKPDATDPIALAKAVTIYGQAGILPAQQNAAVQRYVHQQNSVANIKGPDPFPNIENKPVRDELALLIDEQGGKAEDFMQMPAQERAKLQRQAASNVKVAEKDPLSRVRDAQVQDELDTLIGEAGQTPEDYGKLSPPEQAKLRRTAIANVKTRNEENIGAIARLQKQITSEPDSAKLTRMREELVIRRELANETDPAALAKLRAELEVNQGITLDTEQKRREAIRTDLPVQRAAERTETALDQSTKQTQIGSVIEQARTMWATGNVDDTVNILKTAGLGPEAIPSLNTAIKGAELRQAQTVQEEGAEARVSEARDRAIATRKGTDPLAHMKDGQTAQELHALILESGKTLDQYTELPSNERAVLTRQAEKNVATRVAQSRLDDATDKKQMQLDLVREANLDKTIPPEKMQFYLHPDSLTGFTGDMTPREMAETPHLNISARQRVAIDNFVPIRAQIAQIDALLSQVYGPGGALAPLRQDKGIDGKLKGKSAALIATQLKTDPYVQALNEALTTYNMATTRLFEGLKGNAAARLVQPAIDRKPTITPGFWGLPDSYERIKLDMQLSEQLMRNGTALMLGLPLQQNLPALQTGAIMPTTTAPTTAAPAGQAPAPTTAPPTTAPRTPQFTPEQNQYFNPGKPQ